MAVSLRLANAALVVSCVLVVAVLCTTLSVVSADEALESSRSLRAESIDAAFDAGSDSVRSLARDLLLQLEEGTTERVRQLWQIPERLVHQVCDVMNAQKPEVMASWEFMWSLRSQLLNTLLLNPELSSATISSVLFQTLQYYESAGTYANGPDEYHHINVRFGNGTRFDLPGSHPASQRIAQGDALLDGSGDVYQMNGAHGVNGEDCDLRSQKAISSNGTQLERPCRTPSYELRELGLLQLFPLGVVRFTQLVSAGPYVGIVSGCVYGDRSTAQKMGAVVFGCDLRRVTSFMRTIDVGQTRGSLGRVFSTVRFNWMSPIEGAQVGYLTGTSHGTSFAQGDTNVSGWGGLEVLPMPAVNSSDLIVAGSARRLHAPVNETTDLLFAEHLAVNGEAESLQLPTERHPDGEEFYVKVSIFDNGRGFNWYINVLIDREYLLGEVDRRTAATRSFVAKREDEIQQDLRDKRIVLYIAVALASVVPLLLSLLLVVRVTRPLIDLSGDMAQVAMMNLDDEALHRKESALREVREMQHSFRQMFANLKEYRQYLPQSVLCASESEQEDDLADGSRTDGLPSTGQSLSRSGLSRETAHNETTRVENGVLQAKSGMQVSLKPRGVTVCVSNIHGFHDLCKQRGEKGAVELHAKYLTPVAENAKHYRGIVDDVYGDKVVLSFNTVIPTAIHHVRAVECAMFLSSMWEEMGLGHNCAVSTGKALAGNIGCAGLKKYNMIGFVVGNARMLERVGKSWQVPTLIDSSVAKEVNQHYLLRCIAVVQLRDTASMLHQVMQRKKVGETQEWMYELQTGDTDDVYKPINDAVAQIYAGEAEAAAAKLGSCTLPGAEEVRAMIQLVAATGRPPALLRIFDLPNVPSMKEPGEGRSPHCAPPFEPLTC